MALIKLKRGNKANLPSLEVGEPAFCLDTNELYVGTASGNKLAGDGTFLELAGGTMTGSLILAQAPDQANEAATKAYVDSLALGLDLKPSVRVCSTGNVSVSAPPAQIDGVTLQDGDRVLLVGQNIASQNGIWVFWGSGQPMLGEGGGQAPEDDAEGGEEDDAEGGEEEQGGGQAPDEDASVMLRPGDFTTGKVTSGAFVFVEEGTQSGAGYILTTPNPITVDTTPLTFTKFAGTSYAAGNGLQLVNNTFSVKAGNGIRVDANGVAVKPYNGIQIDTNGVSVKAADSTINVSSSGVKVGTIGSANIANGAVGSAQIAAKAVTAAKLGADVAGTGLSGGNGNAIAVNFGTTAGTVCQGNDSRLHNQNTDAGTSNSTFYIGSSGVKLKTVSGVLVVRDNADSAYAALGGISLRVLNNTNNYAAIITGMVSADRTLSVPDLSGTILTDNSTIDGGTF